MATEYELKRIENIKRNDELLASLNIKAKLADLSVSAKRHRAEIKAKPEKKTRYETPIVTRRSLRSQGKAPDSTGLKRKKKQHTCSYQFARELAPFSMRDAITCSVSDEPLVNKILSVCRESRLTDGGGDRKFRVRASIDLESMELAQENIACVVQERIVSVKFFPSADLRMAVVGTRLGKLGFWNVDSEDEDGDGIYMYHPYPTLVSAILIHPFSLNKVVTSCYGGFVRSLDIKKETFGLVYHTQDAVFSMAQQHDDVNSLYIGEGRGVVNVWDERSARSSNSWTLHDYRINTIDFNSENTNMMATSSSDGTACIWDLRKLSKRKPESLKVITHKKAVNSAYFSPSGGLLATTSLDNKIGVLRGANYEDEFMINHNNKTGRHISSFKGVWGWDDSYIFVGSMKRGVDVISTEQKRLVTTFKSPYLTDIPCCFDSHPFNPGMLAGATSCGQVYIWTL